MKNGLLQTGFSLFSVAGESESNEEVHSSFYLIYICQVALMTGAAIEGVAVLLGKCVETVSGDGVRYPTTLQRLLLYHLLPYSLCRSHPIGMLTLGCSIWSIPALLDSSAHWVSPSE